MRFPIVCYFMLIFHLVISKKPNFLNQRNQSSINHFKSIELIKAVGRPAESKAYRFGKNGGSIVFNFAIDKRPDSKLDSIELSVLTYSFNCTLIKMSSESSADYILLYLKNGVPQVSYNLGSETHLIRFNHTVQVNDGKYHKLRFNRFGQNSTLQLDSNLTVNLHPAGKQYTVFNAHSRIRLSSVISRPNEDHNAKRKTIASNADDSLKKLQDKLSSLRSKEDKSYETFEPFKSEYFYGTGKSNQFMADILQPSFNRRHLKSSNEPAGHFEGIMLNAVVNRFHILEMAAQDNPNVMVNGDVHLLFSLPLAQDLALEPSDSTNPYQQMQSDQNAAARSPSSTKDAYESDDLIFSGSGCYDDEDECTNYVEQGSGYDDLITPVYVPVKPTPVSKPKFANGPTDRSRIKCLNNDDEEDGSEDDDDEDENEDDCGSGVGPVSSAVEETTERGDLLYPVHATDSHPVTIDDDDKSILFTSKPIPPPEMVTLSEPVTRRPMVAPKRPSGPIELVVLPLPSLPGTPSSNNDKPDPASPAESADILSSIHINKNNIELKFNKTSADRTALAIAVVAILLIAIVIITPIVVFVKMRLKVANSAKLTGNALAYHQNKSYASLAASGSMPHPLATLTRCNTPANFVSNPNFNTAAGLPYATNDKAPKLPKKKDLKEWYV